jgi:hypothetical protein
VILKQIKINLGYTRPLVKSRTSSRQNKDKNTLVFIQLNFLTLFEKSKRSCVNLWKGALAECLCGRCANLQSEVQILGAPPSTRSNSIFNTVSLYCYVFHTRSPNGAFFGVKKTLHQATSQAIQAKLLGNLSNDQSCWQQAEFIVFQGSSCAA